jgi:glutathione S-transferase
MSYRLYYSDRTAAMGVRVLLEEIEAPYELIWTDISPGSNREPELLSLNPNGWIPVLIWEKGAIYECGAIATFLCDRHPEYQLAPGANDSERGLFLQWLFFFSSSVQNAYQMSYYPDRFCDTTTDEATVKRRSITRLRESWEVVDDAIGENDWLLGELFSAADIYLFMLTTWLSESHEHPLVESFANVNRVATAVMQRPSVQLVYKSYINGLTSGRQREVR